MFFHTIIQFFRVRENDAVGSSDAFALSNYQAFDKLINDLRDNVMPFVKENFSILEDRENTTIGGFSMGGRTVLYIGMSMQESFWYKYSCGHDLNVINNL